MTITKSPDFIQLIAFVLNVGLSLLPASRYCIAKMLSAKETTGYSAPSVNYQLLSHKLFLSEPAINSDLFSEVEAPTFIC